jgi:lysophospholipase
MFLLFLLPLSALAALDSFPDPSQDQVTDYAPSTNIHCPSEPLLRVFTPDNQALHLDETRYIQTRESTVIADEWKKWIYPETGAIDLGYNFSEFEGRYPRVGFAIPGGGLRAAQYGAGVINALDRRNGSSQAAGTGGLLQVASYLTGLSGGSWITGSLYFNNWPTIPDLVFGNGEELSGWLLDLPFVSPDGVNVFTDNNQDFYGSVLWSVQAKADAGIDTSITDPWSRMISYHFLNQTNRPNFFSNDTAHGAGQLWSRIPDVPAFQSHLAPFPIAVADSRPVGSNLTTTLPLEPVVYEISPLEFGSFDPNLSAMMNTAYAGTHLNDSKPDNDTACVTGFDQAGFVMGTSASLFNQIFDFAHNTLEMSQDDFENLNYVLQRQLRSVRTRADDVANWPSPFTGINPGAFLDSGARWIELLDGASNLENIPLAPLFVNARGVDTIIVLEGSADDPNNWPNGTGLLVSSQRQQQLLQASHRAFPPLPPTANDFENMGVNARATFFGCDPARNSPPEFPMVIYLPNMPPINKKDPVTNSATFQLTYTAKHTRLFLDQVHENIVSGFTPNSNDPDTEFGVCLKCAALDRGRFMRFSDALANNGTNAKNVTVIPRSARCQKCFDRYCYDPQNPPSKDDLPPGRKLVFVDPDPQGLDRLTSFLGRSKFGLIGGFAGLAVFLAVLIAFLLWWRKRREKQYEYQAVSQLHNEEAPWVSMAHARSTSYEMPAYNGSMPK